MKKFRKKNQLILTLLAVMIAVAGYLTYLPDEEDTVPVVENQSELLDLSEEDILSENLALEQAQYNGTTEAVGQEDQSDENIQPGEAVLTWAEQVENVMAEAQLSREQVRTRNEETLNSIINNESLSQEQRQTAADNLMKMTENAQMEANIESILETKGIAQTLVTINESGVEVLVGSNSITDAERAQIEDTVKREADVEASEVVISLMNSVNTEVVEETTEEASENLELETTESETGENSLK